MNTQTQTATSKPIPDVLEHRKLVGVVLVQSSRYNSSETITAKGSIVSGNGINVTVEPARLIAGGDWRPTINDETATGIGVTQRRGSGKDAHVARGYFPMAAVFEFLYSA